MKTSIVFSVLYWILLNILIVACMDLALFMQTTLKPDASIYKKLMHTEFWATMEWLMVVPAQRIGNTFLNPAQLNLSSFVFDFIGQIVKNNFWLKIQTTIDDYCGMVLKTDLDVMLNLQNRICKIYIKNKQEWIYFKVASETAKTLSGYRLQRDQYNNNKFYVTDEKNKWHGIITDGSFTKGRWIDVYN